MRERRLRWMALILLLCAMGLASAALAAEFSADVVESGHGRTASGRIYVKGTSIRSERKSGNLQGISIINIGKRTTYLLEPRRKLYWEQKLTPPEASKLLDSLRRPKPASGAAGRPKRAGTQTVNGYLCDEEVSDSKQGKTTIWYARKLGMPIKVEVTAPKVGTFRQEYKNIKEGPQPASLFEVPKGYKRIEPPADPAGTPGTGRRGAAGRGRR